MEKNIVKEIDSILIRNRNILKEHFVAGRIKISESELVINGFNLTYHTSQIRHEDGNKIYKFCFDYGIGKLDDIYFEIIKLPL